MNYKQLKTLYKKEIMDVLRDKKTILTMVVLPIILYPLLFFVTMQIVAIIQTKQQEETYIVAYDGVDDIQQKELNAWIDGDEDNLDYIFKYVESDNPQKDLENETIDTYVTMKEENNQVIFEIHYLSAISNSNTASNYLKEEIDAYSNYKAEENVKDLGLDVVSVLHPVKSAYKDHSSSESSIGSILGGIIPFLMITAILMGAMYPAIDATAGEKERGTLETLLTLPIGNMELIMSKFLSVATIAVVSVFINVISMGGIAMYLYATISTLSDGLGTFKLASFLPAALVSIVCVLAFALFMSALVMSVCAFAKSFKEANNYITPLTLIVMLTGYIGFIPNIELNAKTALIPVANICLLMKNLLIFKFDLSVILIVLFSNMIYAFVAVWFLGKVYNSESILFGESASGIKLFEKRNNIKKGSIPSIQEGLFILVIGLLLMLYVGGLISVKNMVIGLIVQQLFIGLLPLLTGFYIKADLKKTFGFKLPGIRHILGAICMYFGVGSFSLLLSNLLTFIFKESGEALSIEYETLLEGVPFVGALLLMAVLPAVMEELMFRGYLYTAFTNKMNFVPAMLCVSLLFGISHMSLIKLLPTAILGCGLFYVRHHSGSMIPSFLIHFLNNGFAVFLMYYGNQIPFFRDATMGMELSIALVIVTIVFAPLGVLFAKASKK
ncbi:MAG: ABC transporter permease subunit/CPBP intramembrane protease [Lachnospiraceae bacterium]